MRVLRISYSCCSSSSPCSAARWCAGACPSSSAGGCCPPSQCPPARCSPSTSATASSSANGRHLRPPAHRRCAADADVTVALDSAGRDDRVKGLLCGSAPRDRHRPGPGAARGDPRLPRAQQSRSTASPRISGRAQRHAALRPRRRLRRDLDAALGRVGLTGFTLETPFVKDTLDKLASVPRWIIARIQGRGEHLTSAAMPGAAAREHAAAGRFPGWPKSPPTSARAASGGKRRPGAGRPRPVPGRRRGGAEAGRQARLSRPGDAAAKKHAGTTETMSFADYAEGAARAASDAPRIALIYGLGTSRSATTRTAGLLGRQAAIALGPDAQGHERRDRRCRHQGDRVLSHRQPAA